MRETGVREDAWDGRKLAGLAAGLNVNALINEPMARHTSFCTGGPADCLFMPRDEQGLVELMKRLQNEGVGAHIIGRGTNLLVADAGVRGAVVKIAGGEPALSGEGVVSPAGATLKSVAMLAAQNGLSGLETVAGIPGSLGGGIAMNAGAYGGEIKDCVEWVKVLSGGEVKTLSAGDMRFSYRHSAVFDEGYIVLSAGLALCRKKAAACLGLIEEFDGMRKSKQPLSFPNAGSTFKRPEGKFAGGLIDKCGLKGTCVGGAEVSELHAGFIINSGGATSDDIMRLIRQVQQKVLEETGVALELEIRTLGEFKVD